MARRFTFDLRDYPQLQRFLLRNARPTGRQFGVGSYGSVEELEIDGLLCAGKKLHDVLVEAGNDGAQNIAEKFVEECTLISDLRHPHIVQFLGICSLPGSELPVLVMECLPLCLDGLLENTKDIPLAVKRSILCDVARGLTYLHSKTPPIIHRDLTAKNVLLNSAMVAKIADLGVARILNLCPGQMAATMTQTPGTLAYMPQEVLEENPKYSTTIDMFSYGHLSLFTVIQVFPLPVASTFMDPNNPGVVVARTEIQRRMCHIQQMSQQLDERHPLVHLVMQCLHNDPRQRPSASQALHQLEQMKAQIEDPYQHMTKLEMIQSLRKRGAGGGGWTNDLVTQLQAQLQEREAEAQQYQSQAQHYQSQAQQYQSQAQQYQSQAQLYLSQLQQVNAQLQEREAEAQHYQSQAQQYRSRAQLYLSQLQQVNTSPGKPHAWTHSMPGPVKNIPPRFQKMTTSFPRPSSTGNMYRSPGMRSDSMAYQRNEWSGRNPSGMRNDSQSWKSGVRGDYIGRSVVVGVPAGYEDRGRDEWHISDENQRGWKSDAGLQKSGAAFRPRVGSLPSDISQRVVRYTPEGIPPWKKEFENATAINIKDLCEKASNSEDLKFQQLIRVIGWSGGMHKDELTKEGIPTHKFLLYNQYKWGRRVLPAIMLYFRRPFWDTQEFPDPISLGEGARLRVYGYPFVQYSKKKNVGEPALSVKYYEKMSSASGPSSTTTSPRESRSGSPGHQTSPGDIPATRKVDIREPLQLKMYELLSVEPGGIWGKRLSREYEKKFGESAPKDLMQKAKIMPFIKWEEVVEGTPILYMKEEYKAEEASPPTTQAPPPATPPSPLGGLQITISSSMNGRVVQREMKETVTTPTGPIPEPTSLEHPSHRTEPHPSPAALTEPQTSPALMGNPPPLPCTVDFTDDEEIYDVMVSNVCSLISFYVQRTGESYQDKWRDLEQKLNEHFTKSSAPASSVARDCLYGYCWWEEESEEVQWYRALVVSLESPQANVFFPDYGNSEVVDVKELKELPFEFYQLPFQAVHCCLHGMMEGMNSDKAIDKFYELAADKPCVAHIMDSSGSRVSVELMDPEVGETINSILLKTYHPIATLVPQLPTPGSSMVPIVLTDIDDNGVISVQVEGPGLNQLQQLMAQINEAYSKLSKAADFVGKVSKGMVCCAKFTTDQQWYRVQVKTTLSLNKVSVEYVDYGNEEELKHLKLRKALDTDLFSLPFQAVKCRLHGLPPPEGHWTDDAVSFVVGYVVHEDYHLEVVEAGEEGTMPSVKVFVKEGSNLICLNELMLARVHLFGLPSTEDPLGDREAEELVSWQ